jgi:hypothetical protein
MSEKAEKKIVFVSCCCCCCCCRRALLLLALDLFAWELIKKAGMTEQIDPGTHSGRPQEHRQLVDQPLYGPPRMTSLIVCDQLLFESRVERLCSPPWLTH